MPMRQTIEYPTCTVCTPHRQHPEGAPHLIEGQYFEMLSTSQLAPMDPFEAKAEHRRASVRAAVQRLRLKEKQQAFERVQRVA